MENKLELIRKKCIEANPDILKLEFGCEVVADFGEYETVTVLHACGKCTKHKKASSCNMDCDIHDAYCVMFGHEDDGFGQMVIEPERIKEKLGRSIRLADVLHAKNSEGRQWWSDAANIVEKWNLHQDDLSKQSPETVEFLANLLQ